MLFICFFGITKYAAATGFTVLRPAGGKGFGMLRSLGGTRYISPASHTMMVLMDRDIFVGWPGRVTAMPSVPHIFKMLGSNLKRRPLIWSLVPIAYVVGFVACAGVYLQLCYLEGGLNGYLVSWVFT